MVNGYLGKILWVDLLNQQVKDEALDEKLCRDYLGGYGLGARILFSRQKPGIDALGPDNILGFITGMLTGTDALGGSRYSVVAKSPLTGTWGDASSGGYFGPYLRLAGYDAVFLTGIADKPVYLLIDNGKPEIRDAAHLWGKDNFKTDDALRAEHDKTAKVVSIGPAGERLSLVSCLLTHKGAAAGRSGLGAVMGSKRLKAVVVKGEQKVPVADMEAAAIALGERRKRVLVTIGQKELAPFKAHPQHAYVIRAVDAPDADSLPPDAEVITARGPFAEADERRLLSDRAIEVIVTKNSGGLATQAKLAAVRALGIPVIMVARPAVPEVESVASASARTSSRHSGCASTFMPGTASRICRTAPGVICS